MQQTSIQRQQNAIRQENGKRRIDRKRRRIRQIRRRCLCLFAILLILAALLTHLSTVQEVVVRLAQGLVTGKTLEKEDYPQSLIDLYERNAEARQFVLDYKTKKDDNTAIDVSADVNAGEIPLFLQWDERWGYRSYGGALFFLIYPEILCLCHQFFYVPGSVTVLPAVWIMHNNASIG